MSVAKAPDRNADSAGGVEASSDDRHIVLGLLLEVARGRGYLANADVELGEGDVDAEIRHLLQCRRQAGLIWRLANDHVRLETDAVDGCAGGLDQFDNADGAVSLASVVLEVVCRSRSILFWQGPCSVLDKHVVGILKGRRRRSRRKEHSTNTFSRS